MAVIKYAYRDPKDISGSGFKIINEGEGLFKILSISPHTSRNGNNVHKVTFKLKDNVGQTTLYMHYLQNNDYLAENIYRICEAIDRVHLYSIHGTDLDQLVGGSGRCIIKTERDEQYGDKSKIYRFIPYKSMQEEAPPPVSQAKKESFDDSLPF